MSTVSTVSQACPPFRWTHPKSPPCPSVSRVCPDLAVSRVWTPSLFLLKKKRLRTRFRDTVDLPEKAGHGRSATFSKLQRDTLWTWRCPGFSAAKRDTVCGHGLTARFDGTVSGEIGTRLFHVEPTGVQQRRTTKEKTMGMNNAVREVVRPGLLEVDRMLVQLRAQGDADLANELTLYRDLAVRSVRRYIDRQARPEDTATVRMLTGLQRKEPANG
jgi:hypothetical protein